MSVTFEVFPLRATDLQWGEVSSRAMELGASPHLVVFREMSRGEMSGDRLEGAKAVSTGVFVPEPRSRLHLHVDDHEDVDVDAVLSDLEGRPEVLELFRQRWLPLRRSIHVETLMGRSEEDFETQLALAKAFADLTDGYVYVHESNVVTLPEGYYDAAAFRAAQFLP